MEKCLLVVTNADDNSSIYCELYQQLTASADWIGSSKATRFKCSLYLGERNGLPYSKLAIFSTGERVLINYYKGSDVICRKSQLARTLKFFNLDGEKWLPLSFTVTPGRSETDDRILLKEQMQKQDSLFIVKATSGAKGQGILISEDFEEIVSFVETKKSSHVVQKYIENPLLLPNGRRKFDIRCWVVLTNEFEAFFYKPGVVRTCSESYDLTNLSNTCSHLSNHCLQEELSEKFGMYETNNEMFFDEFETILNEEFDIQLKTVIESCESIAAKCLACIKEKCKVEPFEKMQHFQVFGFDYMLDESGTVFLLEINGAPACAQRLKVQFVKDLIALVINPFFGIEKRHQGMISNFDHLVLPNF